MRRSDGPGRAGTPGPADVRGWLPALELGWYAVTVVLIVLGRLAGYRGGPGGRAAEYWVMTVLAVLCGLAALCRWWRPAWTGPLALGVTGLGVVVLASVPLGPLGPLRLMLSAAVVPVLLAAATRQAGRWTALGVAALALVGAGLDVRLGGNTLSIAVAAGLVGAGPSRALVLVTGTLLVVLPIVFGLVLRSTDTARRAEELARVRAEERLEVARELHDMVANHVTGIIVAAQAAGLDPALPASTGRALESIETAGNRALAAMARMVGALRTGQDPGELPAAPTTPADAVRAAIGDDDRVRLRMCSTAGGEVSADVATTVHRIVVEALTNARRHAPVGSPIDVELGAPRDAVLTVEITNERARAAGRTVSGGFGLVGLAERAAAVGGRLDVGPVDDHRWRVHAVLPR